MKLDLGNDWFMNNRAYCHCALKKNPAEKKLFFGCRIVVVSVQYRDYLYTRQRVSHETRQRDKINNESTVFCPAFGSRDAFSAPSSLHK